jgi:hypothetical protein
MRVALCNNKLWADLTLFLFYILFLHHCCQLLVLPLMFLTYSSDARNTIKVLLGLLNCITFL